MRRGTSATVKQKRRDMPVENRQAAADDCTKSSRVG